MGKIDNFYAEVPPVLNKERTNIATDIINNLKCVLSGNYDFVSAAEEKIKKLNEEFIENDIPSFIENEENIVFNLAKSLIKEYKDQLFKL